jgi:hypothetical protein
MRAFWSMRLLRDTLLPLAEPPHLYLPRWSSDIIFEMIRTLENKLGVKPEQSAHLTEELWNYFGDAWVDGYESLIPIMENNPKDRHVLAAAVRTGAQTIVTFNLRHFPETALAKWNVVAQSPDDFLIHQFHLDQATVIRKIREQAAERHDNNVERLLSIHQKTAPDFTGLLRQAM